jgi:hypothetical protein
MFAPVRRGAGFEIANDDFVIHAPDGPATRVANPQSYNNIATQRARAAAARGLPSRFGSKEPPTMDTFFDRKQIYIGAILLGIFGWSVVIVRAFTH